VESEPWEERCSSRADANGTVEAAPPRSADGPVDAGPIRGAASGLRVNESGCYLGLIEGREHLPGHPEIYEPVFLTTCDGPVLFGAGPNIGHNVQRAEDEVAAAQPCHQDRSGKT
jgi:hypothetical protein